MSRSTLLIAVAVVVMLGVSINAAIPHYDDSRRHSLGEWESIDLGSVRLPFGWYHENRSVRDDRIELHYGGPAYRAPEIEIEIYREPAELKVDEFEVRGFLTGTIENGTSFFDASRQLVWKQTKTDRRKQHEHTIVAHSLAPREMVMTFTDRENTGQFEATTTRIVDSFDAIPVDPKASNREHAGHAGAEAPEYSMADIDRRRHAYWLVGACLVLIGLVCTDNYMEKKQAEEDEQIRNAERRDSIRARLAAEGTPLHELEQATDDATAKLDDRRRHRAGDSGPELGSNHGDDHDYDGAAERLLQESRNAQDRRRGGDGTSIPFD